MHMAGQRFAPSVVWMFQHAGLQVKGICIFFYKQVRCHLKITLKLASLSFSKSKIGFTATAIKEKSTRIDV